MAESESKESQVEHLQPTDGHDGLAVYEYVLPNVCFQTAIDVNKSEAMQLRKYNKTILTKSSWPVNLHCTVENQMINKFEIFKSTA